MPAQSHRDGNAAENVAVPSRSVRQSERLVIKAAISLFGYHRLLRWQKAVRSEIAKTRAALHGPSRDVLARREHLIALLAGSQTADQVAPDKTGRRPISGLNIALLIPSFQMAKGGAEKVAGRLADSLVQAGAKVTMFCRPPTAAGPAYTLDERVRVLNGIEDEDTHVRQLLDGERDLLIGFGMPNFYTRIAEIAQMLDVPFVIQECNNPDYLARALNGTHLCRDLNEAYWLRQAVLAQAAGIRLTVPAYAESVELELKPFVHAFYNALAANHKINPNPAKKLIGVGTLKNETKNGLAAVRAFCTFSEDHPGWSLHLYGENQFQRELEEIMRAAPHAAIIDHGVINEPDAIYGDAYALLIPSFDEGLPNVVVEAFSYGVPCIGFSDCNGVKHLIQDRETGLLLDRNEPDALEKALVRLADRAVRTDLSTKAAAFARSNLDTKTWEKNWLDLIGDAVSGTDADGRTRTPAGQQGAGPNAQHWQDLLETYCYFAK